MLFHFTLKVFMLVCLVFMCIILSVHYILTWSLTDSTACCRKLVNLLNITFFILRSKKKIQCSQKKTTIKSIGSSSKFWKSNELKKCRHCNIHLYKKDIGFNIMVQWNFIPFIYFHWQNQINIKYKAKKYKIIIKTNYS